MDQLTPPVVTDTNNKTNKPIKKKAALFFSKFSSQKSIAQNQSHGSLSKQNPQNQTQFAIIENQNLSVLPVNLSVASVSLDNQLGDNKNMEAILQISHPREQQTEDLSFTKIQSSNTALVATEKPLLCRRMTKLYQFSQVHQSPISVSDRNSKNSSNIPICRKQLYPLILQKGHYSNSTPLKLYTTLDAITAVEQSYTNNTEQCIGCAGFNRQGNLTPIKESSQTCSRAISAFPLEKDPHSPDSKYPNSTASSIYYRSDEEEAITPSSSECNSTQWTSTDSNTYRYYKSRRSKSHGDYLITIKDPDALCTSEPSSSTSSCYSQNDSDRTDLDRSTSVSSLTSSCSSNISKSRRPALSSKSIFGKSESQKKESKAIAMWHSTVHNLTTKRKSLDRQPEKPKNTEKNRAIARSIINELYSTEKSYYHFLTCIRSNYMEPMQIASHLKPPPVKPSDVHVLFYHLPGLVSMSEKLLYNLEMYAEGGLYDVTVEECPGKAIGRIFKDLEQELVVFLKYAIHYQGHMKSIRRASNTRYVMNIDRTSRKDHHNNYNRLGLADYLIAPFQRVPRYELLLKDLLKHTCDTDTNIDAASKTNDLLHAMDIVNGLAATMNMVQEKISMSLFSVSFYSNLYPQSSTNLALQQTS